MSRPVAAFLDRDGVLNDVVLDPRSGNCESPLHPDDVNLMPGVAAALLDLRAAGFLLIMASNQPAAAKGHVPLDQLKAVQARVEELLADDGATLDDAFLCFCHPDGVVPSLSGPCECRKPAPGMLREAQAKFGLNVAGSWMFGDGAADVGAARAIGCRMALIEHPLTAHRRSANEDTELHAATLAEAVRLLP